MVNSRAKLPDIIAGHTYGRWTVIEKLNTKTHFNESLCLCKCECGTERIVKAASLKNKRSKSCGCYNKQRLVKHGRARSGVANSWYSMINRCTNSSNPDYSYYGGRGIKICDRWLDFNNFVADMGERPSGATLDRVDVNGPYCPENCRWASRKQQCNNQRTNQRVVYNDNSFTIAELADLTGKNYFTLYARIVKYGWTVDRAVAK